MIFSTKFDIIYNVSKKQIKIRAWQIIAIIIYVSLLTAILIIYVPGGKTDPQVTEISKVIEAEQLKSEPEPIRAKTIGITDPNQIVDNSFIHAPADMQKKVYLTFDDGPSPVTPQILDILSARDVKATFFVIKHTNPKVTPGYKQITDAGHTIALHSATHAYKKIYENLDAWWADFEDIRSHVKEHSGVDTRLFRFPGGSSNTMWNFQTRNQIIADVNSRGDVYFDWNISSGDANKHMPSTDAIADSVIQGVESLKDPRAVVLFHDSASKMNTVNALPRIIDTLKEKGYTFDTCDKIMDYPVHHRIKH